MRPPSSPSLSGLSPSYQLGSLLNVSCRTQPGLPPPEISWSINGKQVITITAISLTLNYSISILQVKARSFNISYLPDGLAVSSSVLLLRLSSPKIPSRLVVKCSSHIGQIYQDDVVGRASVFRPSKPVLGEPLLSAQGRHRGGDSLGILVIWVISLVF